MHLDAQTFVSLLLNGLATGSMLFIVACGLSLIFGVTQIVNFAHGSFYMLGAYIAYSLVSVMMSVPGGFWAGVLVAAVVVGIVGGLVEMTVLRRLYKAPELLQLLATFGVVLVVQDVTRYVWGSEDLIGPRVPGLAGSLDFFGIRFPSYNIFLMLLGPAILGLLWLVFHRTRWGTLVRAATEDREMVGVLGVNQRWLFTSVFILGSALAGLGGAVQLPRDSANLGMDFNLLTEAFVVVVIGGLGSISGAFVAALLIGVIQSFGTLLMPSMTLVTIFIFMTIVLVFRPYGLAGKKQVQVREPPRVDEGLMVQGGREQWVLWGLAAAFVVASPLLLNGYGITLLIETLIFILFASSLHFLVGPAGILSFGHAAYFGIGAYFAALGVKYFGLPFLPALIGAPIVAGLGAALFGWLCVRLSGTYRAMLTLALAQIVWSVAWQWISVTGGDNGILKVWPDAWAHNHVVYLYVTLAVVGMSLIVLRRIVFAPFGYALRAARDSSARAVAIGIEVRRVQWAGFVLAGALAGLGGALYAFAKGSVFPDVASIAFSVDGLVMLLLGGLESLAGPIVGAAGYHWLLAELQRTTEYWRAPLGIVIVLAIIFFPRGIVGMIEKLVPHLFRRVGLVRRASVGDPS
ncbi:ABC transporter permease [Xanthobacter dioxanivorans]|uniref:ABC transporter permease n=1 Tax=Xanthobacter dioxanivorans TaxID=2528964 RepID=A0A974PMD8_9HYPH|nr:ABC transporter permease [Xanthobacter dioxanivorans]QRG06255.1 ABC transporter permease [Xanthobacter dioxanivorans]